MRKVRMFSRKEIFIFILVTVIGLSLSYACRLEAGEWNEKPVMCSERDEVFDAITAKNEIMLFSGLTFSKVRTGFGTLEKEPATLPFSFYVNLKSGTYTVVEYHEAYKTYCVVAYGSKLQSFVGGIE